MAAVLLLAVLAPAAAAALAAVVGWRPWVAWTTVGAAAVVLAAGVATATATADGHVLAVAGVLRADALTAVMLLVIGAVAVIATWSAVGYVRHELAAGLVPPRAARRFAILVPLFVSAMAVAVLATNLGVMWAAVEGTTIVTAFLVGHHGGRRAIEATWKYVIICSVGIALAYLGTVLVYYASQHAGGAGGPGGAGGAEGSLDWTVLLAQADRLDAGVLRIAFVLLVLGFGTKAGLVPLHSWLPDAHSQAPAPVSALMSGVLLSVAVYALLRYRVIAVAALDPTFVRALLLVVALGSILVATSMMIAQRDYKRLLAYSSIEHMGLAVVGVAVGTPLAVAALLLHVLGHGLAKAVLFCASGQVLDVTGSTRVDDVRGLLARHPAVAGVLAVGVAALLGLPPFSIFGSELALVRATSDAGLGWVVAVVLALLLVAFVAVARPVAAMVLGTGRAEAAAAPGAAPGAGGVGRPATSAVPLVLGLVVLALLGVVTPVDGLLQTAATIVGSR